MGVSDINMLLKVEAHVGIFGIIIADGFRREGIGKMLMQCVIDEVVKEILELRIVELSVFANNEVAVKFYQLKL